MGGQSLRGHRPTTGGARPIGAGRKAVERLLEALDIGLGLAQEIDDQGPLEADGRALRVVLVVGRGERRRPDEGVQIASEAGGAGLCPLPLGL